MKNKKNAFPLSSGLVANQVELAAQLGVTRRSVNTWSKLPGAPAARSNGKIDVEAWRKFVADSNLKAADTPDIASLKVRRLQIQCEEAEFDLACKRREFVPAAEMRRTITRGVVGIKARLLAIPTAHAQSLAIEDDAVEVEQELRKAIFEALTELEKSEWAKCLCPKCGAEVTP